MYSIPVIGTAVVNSTYWVSKLIMSVDYPVDNFFIVNNNGRWELDAELDNLKNLNKRFIKKITITHLPSNIGCSGAWNLIIKCYMNSPYWIIVNDDVTFGLGLLEEMATKANANPNVGLIHGHSGEFNIGSWDLFLIRDYIIQDYGLFDENLYPAYCEDADYIMRFMHSPINKIMSLDSTYYHGNAEKGNYATHGSQTQKTEPELKEKLDAANYMNIEYLNTKWGVGWRECCPSATPFAGTNSLISATRYDLNFVRKKNLGF